MLVKYNKSRKDRKTALCPCTLSESTEHSRCGPFSIDRVYWSRYDTNATSVHVWHCSSVEAEQGSANAVFIIGQTEEKTDTTWKEKKRREADPVEGFIYATLEF
ncbi:hypothetical protein SNK03_011673 [Fusarium graminearum]